MAKQPQAPQDCPRLGTPARYSQLPRLAGDLPVADVAVLRLRLVQAVDSRAMVGQGKAAVECAVLEATVTPWTDADSLTAWAAHNADVISAPRGSGSARGAAVQQRALQGEGPGGEVRINTRLGGSSGEGGLLQIQRLLQNALVQLTDQAASSGASTSSASSTDTAPAATLHGDDAGGGGGEPAGGAGGSPP